MLPIDKIEKYNTLWADFESRYERKLTYLSEAKSEKFVLAESIFLDKIKDLVEYQDQCLDYLDSLCASYRNEVVKLRMEIKQYNAIDTNTLDRELKRFDSIQYSIQNDNL